MINLRIFFSRCCLWMILLVVIGNGFLTYPAFADFKNGMDAAIVLGQLDFNSTAAGTTAKNLNLPEPVCSYGTGLFVGDRNNGRVLMYKTMPTENFAAADIVLGHSDFTTTGVALAVNGGMQPVGISCSGGKLIVADSQYNRVLIWQQFPERNGQLPDVVIGQTDFSGGAAGLSARKFNFPSGVASDGKMLFVADTNNNRVLVYNSIPTTNNAPADLVIGQPDFTSNSAVLSEKHFAGVRDVAFDGKRIFLVQRATVDRIVIFNSVPTKNFAPADIVLGQPDFYTSKVGVGAARVNQPHGVSTDGEKLFVAEYFNYRVLIWNSIPARSNTPANLVVGQVDLDKNIAATASAHNFSTIRRITYDGKRLFVADGVNNRILIFNISGNASIKLGPQFEQGKSVVGKVFEDLNGNGMQDSALVQAGSEVAESAPAAERGIAGVKVASDTGIYAITDEDGKFHFDYVETGQHVLKIDESTLPEGSTITTDSPRKITVTPGVLTKVSFGVKLPEEQGVVKSEPQASGPLLKTAITQSSYEIKPRLSVEALQKEEKLIFTIDCNYYLFVKRAELKLFDKNQKEIKTIELPMPLPLHHEIPTEELMPSRPDSLPALNNDPSQKSSLNNLWNDARKDEVSLHYQLSVFDANGNEDRTSIGTVVLQNQT